MTIHVRWPGQTSGPDSYRDGLALIFLVLFASRQKEHKDAYFFIEQSLNYLTFFVLKQRK
jgi:hypothetical protein